MAATREDWERVDALLQDKIEDIDLDYINTVRVSIYTLEHAHNMTLYLYLVRSYSIYML